MGGTSNLQMLARTRIFQTYPAKVHVELVGQLAFSELIQQREHKRASANIGKDDDVSIFFGLSGTGKTTLSADPKRDLIGDDEHVWHTKGVFNIEGGCYAKTIGLTREKEPEIYDAIRFGSILENVVFNPETGIVDYDDVSLTQNTRVAYPLRFIPNARIPAKVSSQPKQIILLTCDAFGVLPPISKLTPDQVMYHFISGYTAKVAGTEEGVKEPEATRAEVDRWLLLLAELGADLLHFSRRIRGPHSI